MQVAFDESKAATYSNCGDVLKTRVPRRLGNQSCSSEGNALTDGKNLWYVQWIIRSQASRTEEGSQTVRVRAATFKVCGLRDSRAPGKPGQSGGNCERKCLRRRVTLVR